MKRTIKRFVVWDPNTKFYLVRTLHHSYTSDNHPIFDTRFTDKIDEAQVFVSEEAAGEVIRKFSTQQFIQTEKFKVDASVLTVGPIDISFELLPK